MYLTKIRSIKYKRKKSDRHEMEYVIALSKTEGFANICNIT